MLKTVLDSLKLFIQPQSSLATQGAAVLGLGCRIGLGGILETCEQTVNDLIALFPPNIITAADPSRSRSRKRKRDAAASRFHDIAMSLAWPLKKAKADRFREEIARCRENIVLANIADSA
jgi:hypothetical protein